jgi:hypothetical protein
MFTLTVHACSHIRNGEKPLCGKKKRDGDLRSSHLARGVQNVRCQLLDGEEWAVRIREVGGIQNLNACLLIAVKWSNRAPGSWRYLHRSGLQTRFLDDRSELEEWRDWQLHCPGRPAAQESLRVLE